MSKSHPRLGEEIFSPSDGGARFLAGLRSTLLTSSPSGSLYHTGNSSKVEVSSTPPSFGPAKFAQVSTVF
jgi:hypothetical protein